MEPNEPFLTSVANYFSGTASQEKGLIANDPNFDQDEPLLTSVGNYFSGTVSQEKGLIDKDFNEVISAVDSNQGLDSSISLIERSYLRNLSSDQAIPLNLQSGNYAVTFDSKVNPMEADEFYTSQQNCHQDPMYFGDKDLLSSLSSSPCCALKRLNSDESKTLLGWILVILLTANIFVMTGVKAPMKEENLSMWSFYILSLFWVLVYTILRFFDISSSSFNPMDILRQIGRINGR